MTRLITVAGGQSARRKSAAPALPLLTPTPVPPGERTPVACDVVLPFAAADEEFVAASADSVLNQNAADVTLHLIADGHDPGDAARRFAAEPNVRLYRTAQNVGPYLATMSVWRWLRTPFLANHDADDASTPNRVWHAVTELERSGADLFGAACEQYIDRRSRGRGDLAAKLAANPFHRSGVVWPDVAPLGVCVNPSLVVRRAAIERLNGWADFPYSADCELNTRARYAGLKCITSGAVHVLRRLHDRSLSHGGEHRIGSENRERFHEQLKARYRQFSHGMDPRPWGGARQIPRRREYPDPQLTGRPVLIFSIGYNKTGSTSLHAALKALGLRSSHDGARYRRLVSDLRERDTSPLLDQFDAFVDHGSPAPAEFLLRTFPDAKFVLTTRDREKWLTSWVTHWLHARVKGIPTGITTLDPAVLARRFDEHHAAVRSLFAGRPNYLEMDFAAGDGWDRLCPFLGLPVPGRPFPRANTGAAKLREILDHYEGAT